MNTKKQGNASQGEATKNAKTTDVVKPELQISLKQKKP